MAASVAAWPEYSTAAPPGAQSTAVAGVGLGLALAAGVGVAVGVAPGPGVGVFCGAGLGVGLGAGLGVAAGVGVGVDVAAAVAVGLGVGVAPALRAPEPQADKPTSNAKGNARGNASLGVMRSILPIRIGRLGYASCMNTSLSLRSHLLRRVVRWLVAPTVSGTAPVAARRRQLERITKLSRLRFPAGSQIEATQLGGVPGLWLRNTRVARKRTVLYLHGGAYAVGSTEVYREFNAHLARAWHAQVAAIDYRLAPEHPFPAALDDAFAAYQALLKQGIAPADLVIAGDSAGGNLTLACALRVRDAGLPLPAKLVLLSPWTDMTVSGSSANDKPRDDMLITQSIRKSARDYLAGTDAKAALASPLFADLRGLPPTLIQVTDTEILLDDARRLADALRKAQVPTELRVWPGLWHVWPLFAGKLPEADAAVAEAAAFLDRT